MNRGYFVLLLAAIVGKSFAQDSLATIHFYHPYSYMGVPLVLKLYHDTTFVQEYTKGSIFLVRVLPGGQKFWAKTETKEFVFINAKAGGEYFVRCTNAMGLVIARPKFKIVKKEEAEPELAIIREKNARKEKNKPKPKT